MLILALAVSCLVVFLIGKLLVRRLGWPTSIQGAGRWGAVLLGLAVFFAGCPELVRKVQPLTNTAMPTVELGDLVPALLVLGLAILGYVSWTREATLREAAEERDTRALRQPRTRALPPAPEGAAQENHGFRPIRAEGANGRRDGAPPSREEVV